MTTLLARPVIRVSLAIVAVVLLTLAGFFWGRGFAPYPEDPVDNGITSGSGTAWLKGTCYFNTRSVEPHRSGDHVLAQGSWGANSACPSARVNVVLYGWWCDSHVARAFIVGDCEWKAIADVSSVVGPRKSYMVTAQSICTSDEPTGMLSEVDVNLLGWEDTAERSHTSANVNCRPPNARVPPALVSAEVNGTSLVLSFDKDLYTASPTAADEFWIRFGGGALHGATAISISGRQVTLTVPEVRSGQVVTVSYFYFDWETGTLMGSDGAKVDAFSDQDVTVNTGP
ncbi:MAG: SwmB domain-containing protein [Chloroflexi bacterium]|nr:SwmB domain-containing protein [Chloroflexota bacterium]